MEKEIRHFRSAIEDLAFSRRSSRGYDGVRRLCCIEHDFSKGLEMQASAGTEDRVKEVGCQCAQFRAAEKDDEGMALKILTRAEEMPDG